jgi:hypothetical protein
MDKTMKLDKCSYSLLFAVLLQATLACSQVKIEVQDNQIAVSVNGKPFTALQKGKDANKPYLYPLLTASGKRVTRGFPVEKIAGVAPRTGKIHFPLTRLSRIFNIGLLACRGNQLLLSALEAREGTEEISFREQSEPGAALLIFPGPIAA